MTTMESMLEEQERKRRAEQRNPLLKLNLGDLVIRLIDLKEEYRGKLVDKKNCPYPENYDKYGGIKEYNEKIRKEYEQVKLDLIKELARREEEYNSYTSERRFG